MITYEIEQYLSAKDESGYKLDMSFDRLNLLLNATGGQVANTFKDKLLPPTREYSREGRLYSSDATKCVLQNLYKYLGIPSEPFDPRVKLGFFYGQLIETGLVFTAVVAGVNLKDVNKKMYLDIGGVECGGKSDGIHTDEEEFRRNVEFKSMSGFSYKRFNDYGLDDSWGYQGQIQVYMRHQLKEKLIDSPGETIYVACNKDTLHITERVIRYDPEYAIKADENFKQIIACAKAKKQMPRPVFYDSGGKVLRGETNRTGLLPIGCSYCGMKYTCWTRPKQIVNFSKETGEPVFSKKVKQTLKVSIKNNRWGSARPEFRLVNV